MDKNITHTRRYEATEYKEQLKEVLAAILDEGLIHDHGDFKGWFRSVDRFKGFNEDETVKELVRLVENLLLDLWSGV